MKYAAGAYSMASWSYLLALGVKSFLPGLGSIALVAYRQNMMCDTLLQ